jgi:hypothetical protein
LRLIPDETPQPGDIVEVPLAPRKGTPPDSPLVAVETIPWWKHPALRVLVPAAGAGILEPAAYALWRPHQTFQWVLFACGCVLFLGAKLCKDWNQVVK